MANLCMSPDERRDLEAEFPLERLFEISLEGASRSSDLEDDIATVDVRPDSPAPTPLHDLDGLRVGHPPLSKVDGSQERDARRHAFARSQLACLIDVTP